MIEIGKRKRGKFRCRVKKGKKLFYVYTGNEDEKDLLPYVAYMFDKDIGRMGIYDPKEGSVIVLTILENNRVEVQKREALPKGKSIEEMMEYFSNLGEVLPLFAEDEKILQAYKEKDKRVYYLAGAVGALAVAFIAVVLFFGREEEPPPPPPAPKYMSEEEKFWTKAVLSYQVIALLSDILTYMPNGYRIDSISLAVRNVPPDTRTNTPEKVYYTLDVVYAVIYPEYGSTLSGKQYIKKVSYKIEATPADLQAFRQERQEGNWSECAMDLIKFGARIESLDMKKASLATQDLRSFFGSLQRLSRCTFYFERLSARQGSYTYGVAMR